MWRKSLVGPFVLGIFFVDFTYNFVCCNMGFFFLVTFCIFLCFDKISTKEFFIWNFKFIVTELFLFCRLCSEMSSFVSRVNSLCIFTVPLNVCLPVSLLFFLWFCLDTTFRVLYLYLESMYSSWKQIVDIVGCKLLLTEI